MRCYGLGFDGFCVLTAAILLKRKEEEKYQLYPPSLFSRGKFAVGLNCGPAITNLAGDTTFKWYW